MALRDELRKGSQYDPSLQLGYSEIEIEKIERLLGYSVSGSVKYLLSDMGKCHGGLLGLDSLMIYSRNIEPGRFYDLHRYLVQDLIDSGQSDLTRQNPFILTELEAGCHFVCMERQIRSIIGMMNMLDIWG